MYIHIYIHSSMWRGNMATRPKRLLNDPVLVCRLRAIPHLMLLPSIHPPF